MASGLSYKYRPLENECHIRLLRLAPGDELAAIKISILHADLDQQPTYEALSYTWGDSKDATLISCDEDGATLAVTRNCSAALRRLRSQASERILWIDAICIDQSNIAERSQQVRLMSDIYARAERVLVYLGEASHNSWIGMDFILQDAQAWTTGNGHRPSVGLGPGITASPQQMAIDHIISRPYFSRIWVIQEVVFARDVQIILGDRAVQWDSFSRAVYYVGINKKLHLRLHNTAPRILSYRERAGPFLTGGLSSWKPVSLLELLRDTRTCEASDARDKIYALLGMSVEKHEQDLAPDYSLTIRETFINLVKFLVGRDRRLDVLCHVQGTRSKHDLPSWVPDWSFPYACHVLGHEKDPSKRPYKASLGQIANVIFKVDPETLVVEGKVFDRVLKVGLAYNIDGDSPPSSLRQWESMVSPSDIYTDASAAFTDTLIANPPYTAPNPFLRLYPSWRRRNYSDQELSMQEMSEATIFQEQVIRACNGRSFFVTQKGRMGLGPIEMTDGDVVAILLGGSVPFILREQGTQFTLVGECYVHGVMKGEMLEDPSVGLETLCII
ncbi:HET domain containing protein [Hyaloscypha variabilis]